MTDKMKTLLNRAASQQMLAGHYTKEFAEARKSGWIELSHYPQNSTVARYRITESGKAAA